MSGMLRRAVTLLLCAFFSVWLVSATYDAARLSFEHRTTTARVEHVSEGKWIDEVTLTCATADGDVEATVDQVWLIRTPRLASKVEVEYDPDKPSRVRIAGQHTYAPTAALCVFALSVAIASEWSARPKGRHRRRRAALAGGWRVDRRSATTARQRPADVGGQ